MYLVRAQNKENLKDPYDVIYNKWYDMIDVIAARSDVCALMLYQWATENPLVSKASTIFMCDTRHLSC